VRRKVYLDAVDDVFIEGIFSDLRIIDFNVDILEEKR